MQSGVISSENMADVFRGISQRRRNGTLEIRYLDQALSIFFVNGKIVDVLSEGVSAQFEVVQIFAAAGLVAAAEEEIPDKYAVLFDWLQTRCLDGALIDPALFRRVIKHRVLERIYAINFDGNAYYTFKIEMVECEKDFLPAISVGQLLLDLVALKSDRARLDELFPRDSYLQVADTSGVALSDEEKVIADSLSVASAIGELGARTMLSSFAIQESLLSLYDRGLVTVSDEPPARTSGTGTPQFDDLLSALDQATDSIESIASEALAQGEVEVNGDYGTPAEGELQGVASRRVSRAEMSVSESETAEDEQLTMQYARNVQLKILNTKMLHSAAIPRICVFLLLGVGLLAPWLFWSDALTAFQAF